MAKNISLMGASYFDVPAVTLPQTGGGTARFDDASVTTATASDVAQGKVFLASDGTITTGTATGGGAISVVDTPDGNGGTIRTITAVDISDTTAVASDVASGKYFYTAEGVKTEGTASGGGGGIQTGNDVVFIDYDGSEVASYDIADLSALPANPAHTGLTSQGWNWTLAQITAQHTAYPNVPIYVGQSYVTSDGKTRLYCNFDDGRLAPYLGFGIDGTAVIDWGDNSATDTVTGSSQTTHYYVQHTYASGGDYVISITVTSGTLSFFGVQQTSYILNKTTNDTTYNISRSYTSAIKRIELGTDAKIGKYAFYRCTQLASITIPNGITGYGTNAFQECTNLQSITIPSGSTYLSDSMFSICRTLKCVSLPSGFNSVGTYTFNQCFGLEFITLPNGLTYVGANSFYQCYSLHHITIPNGVTTLNNNIFQYCYGLLSVSLPNSVTFMGNYVFQYCYSLQSVTLPSGIESFGNYAFDSCNSIRKITFPTGILSIGMYAFNGCYCISKFTIPSDVTQISTYAFSNCSGVAEYHFQSTTPPSLGGTNVFNGIQSDCIIYVPKSENQTVLNAYKTAQYWSTYASKIQEEP